ncbi:MAG: PepSY domain-containing protein [Myxococcales bacterium]|nr:PepSY domain-containing protein [Myxococcales bacterium]
MNLLRIAIPLLALLGCRGVGTPVSDAPRLPSPVGIAQARAAALKTAPGVVRKEELEVEGGREIYSFDIDPEDGSGTLREVHVDPATGEVLKVEREAR